jgi:hypothetical protein
MKNNFFFSIIIFSYSNYIYLPNGCYNLWVQWVQGFVAIILVTYALL